jgi:hypothetical protein
MPLLENFTALALLAALQAELFAAAQLAVSPCRGLLTGHGGLAMRQLSGFPGGQAAISQAVLNPGLLAHIACHERLHALRRGRTGIASHCVVLSCRDLGAGSVLGGINPRLLGMAESTVLQAASLELLDVALLLFQPGRLGGGQGPAAQALLNASLLVDIALEDVDVGLRMGGEGGQAEHGRKGTMNGHEILLK